MFEGCESFFVGDSGIRSGFNAWPGQVDSEPDTVEPVTAARPSGPFCVGATHQEGSRGDSRKVLDPAEPVVGVRCASYSGRLCRLAQTVEPFLLEAL